MTEENGLNANIQDNELDELFSLKFKFWTIDDKGNISRLDQPYEISCDQLTEMNWIDHILKKNIAVASEFYFVYMEALKRAHYKTLIIDLEDLQHKITAIKEKM